MGSSGRVQPQAGPRSSVFRHRRIRSDVLRLAQIRGEPPEARAVIETLAQGRNGREVGKFFARLSEKRFSNAPGRFGRE